jgi:hypothetical protein
MYMSIDKYAAASIYVLIYERRINRKPVCRLQTEKKKQQTSVCLLQTENESLFP